jgi:hypothetical protein
LSTLASEKGSQHFTDSPTYGFWFKRFIEGSHRRMGDDVNPDRAVTIDEMLKLEELWENAWTALEPSDVEGRLKISLMATFANVGYGGGLRGEEVCKADLGATRKHLDESLRHPRKPHVTIGLLGKVKGETNNRCHMLPLALTTASGLEIGKWVHRVVRLYEAKNIVKGPMFRINKGRRTVRARTADWDSVFHDYLRGVQEKWPGTLSPTVGIEGEYSLRRSLRRGSTSQARNKKIPKEVIELNNRWRKVDRSGGRQVAVGMMEHYSDVRATLEALLQYSEAL